VSLDQTEADILAGAAVALRKRAARQREVAKAHGPGSGEAAIALRLAAEFDELAAEFALEVSSARAL
jgi:hypothetical protein